MSEMRNAVSQDRVPKGYFPSVGKFQDIFLVRAFLVTYKNGWRNT